MVVAGGGPAGCATAIALAQQGVMNVCLLNLVPAADGPRLGETIPPESRTALQQIGLWQQFLEQNHEPCLGSCSAWGRDEPGYNDFLFNPNGTGWHLDRGKFDALLLNGVSSLGITLIPAIRSRVTEIDDDYGIALNLIDPSGATQQIIGRYIVDATGTRATLARQLGVRHGCMIGSALSMVFSIARRRCPNIVLL